MSALFLSIYTIILVLSFSAPALAETQEELVAGAKKEGKLVIYASAAAQQLQMYIAPFQKRYPFIKTEFFRTGKQKLVTKILFEELGQTAHSGCCSYKRYRNEYFEEKRRPEPVRSQRSGITAATVSRSRRYLDVHLRKWNLDGF